MAALVPFRYAPVKTAVPVRHGANGHRGSYCTGMVTKKARQHRLYIAEWMKERGLSDEALAERLGVARETVTRYRDVNQQHRLNPQKIAAIAAALDLEPEDLWRPPDLGSGRPSIDRMLKGAPDALVLEAAEMTGILLRRGRPAS